MDIKTFRTYAIPDGGIPHKACTTSYDSLYESVNCKRFNN